MMVFEGQDTENQDTEKKDENKEARHTGFMDEKLFRSRAITVFGQIDDKVARSVTERLLALASDSDDPITLYISSPGGHVESGDVIYDMIKFIRPEVKVIGTGWVGSAAVTVFLAAKKENRFALPNTRFLVHQPSGGSIGVASDMVIQAKEIIRVRARINKLIADETGQPLERVEQDTDRDYWMSVEEAVDYGIAGKIVRSIAEI